MENTEKQKYANQCLKAAKNQTMDNVVVYVDETNKFTGLADFIEYGRQNDFDTAKAVWNFQDGERTAIATVEIFPSLFAESETPDSVISDLLVEEAANEMFFYKVSDRLSFLINTSGRNQKTDLFLWSCG